MAPRKKTKANTAKAGKKKTEAVTAKKSKKRAGKKTKGNAKKAKKKAATAAAPAVKPDGKALLGHLDALHSLGEADIQKIRDCCNATLEYRGLFRHDLPIEDVQSDRASDYCYTKSGAGTNVSIWKDQIKVEETTKQDAEARGILPC